MKTLREISKELEKDVTKYKNKIDTEARDIELRQNIRDIAAIRRLIKADINLKIDNNYFKYIKDIFNYMEKLEENYDGIFGANKLLNSFNKLISLIPEESAFKETMGDSFNLYNLHCITSKLSGRDSHYVNNGYEYENVNIKDVAYHLITAIDIVLADIREQTEKERKEIKMKREL